MSDLDNMILTYIQADLDGDQATMDATRNRALLSGCSETEWEERYDELRRTRCWAHIKLTVDVIDEQATDETVQDALVASIETDGLETNMIEWGLMPLEQQPALAAALPAEHATNAPSVDSLRKLPGPRLKLLLRRLARALYADGMTPDEVGELARKGAHGLDQWERKVES